MKYLKSVDFAGQSIILLLAAGFSIAMLISTGKVDGDFVFILLYAQLFLGPWQMLSAAIVLLLKLEVSTNRKRHFVASILCLLLILLSAWLHHVNPEIFTKVLVGFFLIAVPWMLAIYYYSITWRWVFPKRHTGKFLSHINF